MSARKTGNLPAVHTTDAVDASRTNGLSPPNGEEIIPFPLSIEYASNWTALEALREVLANALDEDPDPLVVYEDGRFLVEDGGPGLDRSDLVLGISRDKRAPGQRKSADQVGQFGEGLCLALLVLAREGRATRVETVGFSVEPEIVQSLDTQVLQLRLTPNERVRGTRVTVRVRQSVAEKARGLFRQLVEPAYEPLLDHHSEVIDDDRGRIYIGGVFVAERPSLSFSYDFGMGYKDLQNRDRSVIDAWYLERAISNAWAQVGDAHLVEKWLTRAFAGKLHRTEWVKWDDPDGRVLLREVAGRLVDLEKTMWVAPGSEELSMALVDEGFTIIEQTGDTYQHRSLMNALGIKEAKEKQEKKRPPKTKWIKLEKLTEAERRVLDAAVTLGERAWGAGCFGRRPIKVFEDTINEAGGSTFSNPTTGETYETAGFYRPRQDDIAISRDMLSSFRVTFSTLLHETAHRLRRHESRWDYTDRTRGFESKLDELGGHVAMLIIGELVPELATEVAEWEQARDAEPAPTPTEQVVALIRERMAADDIKTQRQLALESGLTPSMVGSILRGYAPSQAKRTQALAKRLGLHWEVVHLGLYAGSERWSSAAGEAAQSLRERNERLADDIQPGGGRHSLATDLEPYYRLVEQERVRLGELAPTESEAA